MDEDSGRWRVEDIYGWVKGWDGRRENRVRGERWRVQEDGGQTMKNSRTMQGGGWKKDRGLE